MPHRNALALAFCLSFAAGLVGVQTARAGAMTYSFVDYQAAETDQLNSMQDKLSGTLTISALGSYIAGSVNPSTDPTLVTLSYNITLSNADGNSYNWSDSNTLSAFLGSGTAEFTNSAVLLNSGYFSFETSAGSLTYDLYYRSDSDDYHGLVSESFVGQILYYDQSPATSLDPNPWTIAIATPEPGTLTLSGLGLLALGLVGSRFRRRRAA